MKQKRVLLSCAVALTAAHLIALAGCAQNTQAPIERPVEKGSFTPEALSTRSTSVAVSPNGRHIAYVAGPGAPRLWVRDVDRLEPRELARTEGASGPFWSPNSQVISFAVGDEVKKIGVQGGPQVTLCPSPGGFYGGSWSPDVRFFHPAGT